MKYTVTVLALAGLALSACASDGVSQSREEKAQAVLSQFKNTGETTNCLQLRQITAIKPLDDKHLLAEVRGRNYYLIEPGGRCSGASSPGNALQYETTIARLCKGEIIRVVDTSQNFTVGSCSVKKITKLEKDKDPSGKTALR